MIIWEVKIGWLFWNQIIILLTMMKIDKKINEKTWIAFLIIRKNKFKIKWVNHQNFFIFLLMFSQGAWFWINTFAFEDIYYAFSLSPRSLYSICIFLRYYPPYYFSAISNSFFYDVSTFISSIQWVILTNKFPPLLKLRRVWHGRPFLSPIYQCDDSYPFTLEVTVKTLSLYWSVVFLLGLIE